MNLNININDISETALLTLYNHTFDAQDKNLILNDVSSVRKIHLLNNEMSKSKKKLGKLKLFRHIKLFRKTQWTVHYRFDKIPNINTDISSPQKNCFVN